MSRLRLPRSGAPSCGTGRCGRSRAGAGRKSRLGWEFEKYADGLKADLWWHRGRCLSYGEGVAFWALAEVVRQRLGIAEEDPAEVAAAKLKDGLDRFVPDPAERVYAGVRLSRLLGVAFAPESEAGLSREELFAGWRLFFERLAAVQPLVLVVEDAQYADAGLLDFLDHLIDWTRDLPVYVLVFARPELDQVRSGFGTGRNRSTLTLDPLDIKSMDQLVDALVPGMPSATQSKITSQAQGIPLFAVETVRSLNQVSVRVRQVTPRAGPAQMADSGLLMLGDWDAAERELTQTAESDEPQDYLFLSSYQGLLAALRGDVATAETVLAGLGDLRTSEDPQVRSMIGLLEASTAAARGYHQDVLVHARDTLAYVGVVGISAEDQRWAWPLAVRAAYELRDGTATGELLALLDSYQPGEIAPMLRAERDLARARLAAADGDQAAASSFAAAMTSLRERGTPYHLAQGLLDYAEYLARDGDADSAAQAIMEAREVARHLRCPPLLDRADAVEAAPSQIQA